MKIHVVKEAGFCFGVKRAIRLASNAARSKAGKAYTLGPLIHNPQVVEDLEKKGVHAVKEIRKNRKGTLIIRSHGVHPHILKRIRTKGIKVVDATCPFVKKAQRMAKLLHDQGYQVAVVGEAHHPEVQGIVGYAGDSAMVINHNRMKRSFPRFWKLGVIAQTTLSIDAFKQIIGRLIERTEELKVCNTICDATARTQKATLKLAGKVDMMIVVGGHNSANTTRLTKLCKRLGTSTHHVETAGELRKVWFEGKKSVGVTSGTSTPEWLIKQVVERIRSFN
ncbi:MAG: 4-hydroxy-3-methylbut-2-enyl diphosphate reductase [candidate division Zixibacteria bacterium SM23_73_3]|nr:MAG: 4-hydroxy-3-methylbut-2-enyl diphosphate reductase [candidate division Zixibacteria bacterium SM23_73_3]